MFPTCRIVLYKGGLKWSASVITWLASVNIFFCMIFVVVIFILG